VTHHSVRWGFLGAGFIATTALAPAAHAASGATLHAAASRDPKRAQSLEPKRVHDTYRGLVDDDTVDAVYIALSNHLHLPWIVASLEAGKHVLCEKPLTMSEAECRRAFAAAETHGKLLVEATWVRWHPRHRRADALLGNEAHGRVRDIDARFTFNGVADANYRLDVSMGGGALLDLGPYVLAPVVDWGGTECAVDDAETVLNHNGADLTTTAVLKTESATATIEVSFVSPEHQALDVSADDLSVTWVDDAFTNWNVGSSVTLSDGVRQWSETFPPCDAYQLMLENVSRAICGDGDAYVPPSSLSLRTASLIDAIRQKVTA
jgi:xylose dehydrogenase (NAD/NADP)